MDMSSTLDLAVRAIRGADPARFGDPTPCPEFTVAALIDHMASGMRLAENSARRVVVAWDPGSSPVLGGLDEKDWAQACADQADATAAAWADPAAWEGDADLFQGEVVGIGAAGDDREAVAQVGVRVRDVHLAA